ncbi:TLD-domain-containing protein [Phascolomyces articulosus]|uniref:Oxidation resistance protein 1 n=1 Tax=Phascolomyces articulosus TaxID=60185 RepID=A0AAD5PFS0_9FUNG|nr:TLD-domain-containing protein [Phascolomyces articulosus]
MMKLSALPSIIVNTTDIHHRIAVLNTSPIQCTQFYYYDEGGTATATTGDNNTKTKSTTAAITTSHNNKDSIYHSSSSNHLSRHLEMYDKRRQTMVRRSSTGLFSSLSFSTSSSDEDDFEEIEDGDQKKSLMSITEQNQYPSIKLTQRDEHTWECLDINIAEQLRNQLPSRIAVCSEWTLLYSMDQHGSSLQTMYHQLEKHHGPCLLVIQTMDEEIFGAYLTEPIHVQSRYYGSGECFLWRLDRSSLSSSSSMHAADPNTTTTSSLLETYRWSGKNDYLCYSARDYISMGGGEGRVAIWLNEDLLQGHTESCATFDNEPLSTSSKFECIGLEVWGFRF